MAVVDDPGALDELSATRRSYDAVAARYAAEICDELRGKPLDRGLLDVFAELTTGATVLDVGCGPGHTAAYLSTRGLSVIGVDLSRAMCATGHRDSSLPFVAADMSALPFRSGAAGGILCWYALIHLSQERRAAAYAEFARVLAPGGHAFVAFHTSDADHATGQAKSVSDWWGQPVQLTFRYLDPAAEAGAMAEAGLRLAARTDRAPYAGSEHPSRRSYLLAQR